MVSAVIELGVGYFITYKVPGLLNLKGAMSTITKIIGIVLLLLGFISLVESLGNLLHLN